MYTTKYLTPVLFIKKTYTVVPTYIVFKTGTKGSCSTSYNTWNLRECKEPTRMQSTEIDPEFCGSAMSHSYSAPDFAIFTSTFVSPLSSPHSSIFLTTSIPVST